MNGLRNTLTAAALSAALGIGSILAPAAAGASERGRDDVAVAIGAAALAVLLNHQNHHEVVYRDNRDCDEYGNYGYGRTGARYEIDYSSRDRGYDNGRDYNSRRYDDRQDYSNRRDGDSRRDYRQDRDDRGRDRRDNGSRYSNSSGRDGGSFSGRNNGYRRSGR